MKLDFPFFSINKALIIFVAIVFQFPQLNLAINTPTQFKEILSSNVTQCHCPAVRCRKGISASCKASCEHPQRAYCTCDAKCSSGIPSGSNQCYCN